jgi:NADH:ubiquinone reductase (H+-translocating)
VILAEATGIDAHNRQLILDQGESRLDYDHLLISTGAVNSYFGNDTWEKHAPGLKSIEDATQMRHKILQAFESAEKQTDPEERQAWLTFVIVGAGPTGVELAGAIGEIANDTLRNDFRNINPEESRILLLDVGSRILANYPEELSAKAEKSLIRMGVRSRTSVRVTAIDDNGVTLQGGERILSKTILWAAGVKASGFGGVLSAATGCALDRQGRVIVQPDLTVPHHPEIQVIGDLAYCENDGKALPGVAPVAMQQGAYVANRIIQAETGAGRPFRYRDKGSLAVIGRAAAVADLGFLRLSGFFAWVAWLFIHLLYIVEFESRLLVFIRWGIQYFTFSRGSRLITGEDSRAGKRAVSDL